MSRYAAVLFVPLIVGSLIAVTILLINGLRERREQRRMALREADGLTAPDDATFSTRPARAGEVSRTVGDRAVRIALKDQETVFEETPAGGGDGRQKGR